MIVVWLALVGGGCKLAVYGQDGGYGDGGADAEWVPRECIARPWIGGIGGPDPCFAAGSETVEALLAQMTLEEKLSQIAGIKGEGVTGLTPDIPRLGILGLRMRDGSHGVVKGGTLWPTLASAACSFDPLLEEEVGAASGREFRALGFNVALSPMLNLVRDGRWGRASETYSEDPYLSGKLAAARVRGLQSVGVIANPKHLAAYNVELGRNRYPVVVDERTLRELYLPAFRMAVQEGGAWSVMTAYNDVNGYACSANGHLITDILKCEWSFPGWVVSDWQSMYGNTVGPALAGLDIEMPLGAAFTPAKLVAAIEAGAIAESTIDDKVRRILHVMYCAGMFEPGYSYVQYEGIADAPEQKALAARAARESLVLARNQGGVLPLDKTQPQTIAVVGPYAAKGRGGASGSAFVSAPGVAPLDGIKQEIAGSQTTLVSEWSAADYVIVFVGAADAGETKDRTELELPLVGDVDQNALVAEILAVKPERTIVVYTGGSFSVAGAWSDAPGVIIAFYPGADQGRAIADVLFGDYNPAGRLPVTFPASVDQVPPWGKLEPESPAYNVYEPASEGRGYFYYDRHDLTPLFPFGHGLSYTTFEYANLEVAPSAMMPGGSVEVLVDVRNIGELAGDEVVQLYLGCPSMSIERRVKDLRGFSRIHLAAGETKTVAFDLRESDVAYWSDAAYDFIVEATACDVFIGASSRDLRLQGALDVTW